MKVRAVVRLVGPSIAHVRLSQGQYALIEAEDAERIGQWNWYTVTTKRGTPSYAARAEPGSSGRTVRTTLHAQILADSHEYTVRHRNGNGLDNRRCGNLVQVKAPSRAVRLTARLSYGLSTGVHLHKENVWRASLTLNQHRFDLGRFGSPAAANSARRRAESWTRQAGKLSGSNIARMIEELRSLRRSS